MCIDAHQKTCIFCLKIRIVSVCIKLVLKWRSYITSLLKHRKGITPSVRTLKTGWFTGQNKHSRPLFFYLFERVMLNELWDVQGKCVHQNGFVNRSSSSWASLFEVIRVLASIVYLWVQSRVPFLPSTSSKPV